jgi:hypothetical protein
VNDIRSQDLSEAFASIIEMMLRTIRVHRFRRLIYLPILWLIGMQLRRIGKEFAALTAAHKAGTLRPPAPLIAPEDQKAACAQPEAIPGPPARPDPEDVDQQPPAVPAPTKPVRAPVGAGPRAPDPDRLTHPLPGPFPGRLAVVAMIGPQKNPARATASSHALFVTI